MADFKCRNCENSAFSKGFSEPYTRKVKGKNKEFVKCLACGFEIEII